jgi:hypothetical protein
MSRLLPQNTFMYLRNLVNTTLPIVGIDTHLYIPTNLTTVESLDIYQTPDDLEFVHYECQTYIDWNANVYRLRKRGLFVEKAVPILCYLPTQATNVLTQEVENIEIFKNSDIVINPEYNTSDRYIGTEEFELADNYTQHFSDALIFRVFSIVPRRIKGN